MNRKMLLGGLLAIIIAAGAAWNVSLNSNATDGNSSNVTLNKVEALSNEANYGWEWWTQGATKDETPDPRACTVTLDFFIISISWSGTRIICHNGGCVNCSHVMCD